jgi:hypothetical protein
MRGGNTRRTQRRCAPRAPPQCCCVPSLSGVEFLGEMRGLLHSRALLPLIPPPPFSHKGRRGSLGVLKPRMRKGMQGLPKNLPLQGAPPPRPCAPPPPVRAQRCCAPRSAAAPHRSQGSGRDARFAAFPCAFAPHPPAPLLPQGEKGEFGRPEDQNEKRNAGTSKKPTPARRPAAPLCPAAPCTGAALLRPPPQRSCALKDNWRRRGCRRQYTWLWGAATVGCGSVGRRSERYGKRGSPPTAFARPDRSINRV